MQEKINQLELKVTELENKLKEMGGTSPQIDPEEMKTFHKVNAQLGQFACRICSSCHSCFTCSVCRVCHVCRVCNFCIHECSCGPCIQTQGGNFGGSAFGGFME